MFHDDRQGTNHPPQAPALGLAIASLVLGILAVFLSFLLFGAILALVGLILGAIHLTQEKQFRALAGWGIALSVCGGVLSIAFGGLYWVLYMEMAPALNFDMMENDTLTQWEGVRAPDMTLRTLDGQEITLSDLKGKRVIVDLWATWCPPCVQEIPHFIQLAENIPEDELVIIGVSDEDSDTLNPFIEKKGINYAIVSQIDLPSPYDDVTSIPTTFFIDRNGVIQNIFVGYHDYDSLFAAATAPDVEGTPLDAPPTPREGLFDSDAPLQATPAWSVDVSDAVGIAAGDWDGDGVDEILVTTWDAKLTVLAPDGTTLTSVALPDDVEAVYLVAHTTGPRLLGVSFMAVHMMGLDGEVLWTYKGGWMPTYIEGVHWGDVNGDGNDEIALGMMNGVHLVSADGKRLWRNRAGGMGDVVVARTPAGESRIFSAQFTSVGVFDSRGEELASFSSGGDYCEGIFAAAAGEGGAIQLILDGDEQVIAMNDAGMIAWTAPMLSDDDLMAESFCADGDVNGDGVPEFAFLEADGGIAIASAGGVRLGRIPDQKNIDYFTIAAFRPDGARLVTLQGETLTAYTFAVAPPESFPTSEPVTVPEPTPSSEPAPAIEGDIVH